MWTQPNLRHCVELHHGSGERFSIGTEWRNKTEHGPVEGAVDLSEGGRAWIVHIHNWNMAQEPEMEENGASKPWNKLLNYYTPLHSVWLTKVFFFFLFRLN